MRPNAKQFRGCSGEFPKRMRKSVHSPNDKEMTPRVYQTVP